MKFSTQEVMEVPIQTGFDMLTDFERLEQAAIHRGVDLRRVSEPGQVGVWLAWEAAFALNNRRRNISLQVTRFEPPGLLTLDFLSQGLSGETCLELVMLSASQTRVMVSLEMRPVTLAARLLLQSLKLAKPRLSQRYKARIARHIGDLESRYQRAGSAEMT
ncbi:SRPBCC family protein [uncultured Roseobacter sp.]|uniref:SRPBCC family protein n=1 Tax=uncultured Roseobacter sp. TaxID=114847 RepID=UPI002619C47F|nr:SRPBCC family protein [uncultured Roseobacter sp.]